ncbi:MAG: helix-turn-helix transcriptional regulator [Candidatus Sulfotelmatobacter sp.]
MPRRLKLPPLDLGNETLGQRLARIRKQCGYTQVELAKKIGIIQSLISDYETDRLRLTAEMAVRFALALGVSTDELLHPKTAKKKSKKPSLKVMRRMEEIEKLPPRQQTLVLSALDSILRGAVAR